MLRHRPVLAATALHLAAFAAASRLAAPLTAGETRDEPGGIDDTAVAVHAHLEAVLHLDVAARLRAEQGAVDARAGAAAGRALCLRRGAREVVGDGEHGQRVAACAGEQCGAAHTRAATRTAEC
jgi:hypothetical protein